MGLKISNVNLFIVVSDYDLQDVIDCCQESGMTSIICEEVEYSSEYTKIKFNSILEMSLAKLVIREVFDDEIRMKRKGWEDWNLSQS